MSNRCEAQHFRACDKTASFSEPTHNWPTLSLFPESERERERGGKSARESERPCGRVGRRYAGPRQPSAALSEVGNLSLLSDKERVREGKAKRGRGA